MTTKTPKTPKTVFFCNFFILLPFWRERCFIMVWGMLNMKITEKKIQKILIRRKMVTKNTFYHQKNIFLPLFFSPRTFSLRFWRLKLAIVLWFWVYWTRKSRKKVFFHYKENVSLKTVKSVSIKKKPR